jgi:hypothetical protein
MAAIAAAALLGSAVGLSTGGTPATATLVETAVG